jgi:hypothetical protein
VDDFDDLLLGTDALDQLGAHGLVGDPAHELLNDVEVNVGLEQGSPDFAQPVLDVRLGQQSACAEPAECRVEPFLQVVEHRQIRIPESPEECESTSLPVYVRSDNANATSEKRSEIALNQYCFAFCRQPVAGYDVPDRRSLFAVAEKRSVGRHIHRN